MEKKSKEGIMEKKKIEAFKIMSKVFVFCFITFILSQGLLIIFMILNIDIGGILFWIYIMSGNITALSSLYIQSKKK